MYDDEQKMRLLINDGWFLRALPWFLVVGARGSWGRLVDGCGSDQEGSVLQRTAGRQPVGELRLITIASVARAQCRFFFGRSTLRFK